MILLLALLEISPADLQEDQHLVILFDNTSSNFHHLETLSTLHPYFNFTFFNTTLHESFVQEAKIIFPSTAIHTKIGIQFIFNFSVLETTLKLSQIEPNFENSYLVADELDLLLAANSTENALVFYAGNSCKMCGFNLLQALQLANLMNYTLFYANCDLTRDLTLLCSRQQVRAYPWLQVLQNGKLTAFGKEFTSDGFSTFAELVIEGKVDYKGQKEDFTLDWMRANKSKIGADGRPLEFPIKPDYDGFDAKVGKVEERLIRLEKLIGRI